MTTSSIQYRETENPRIENTFTLKSRLVINSLETYIARTTVHKGQKRASI